MCTPGTTATSTNTSISKNTLAKGEFLPVKVTISYDKNGARADGPFAIEFGGISLEYSTVDGTSNIIEFTINDITYYANAGMTWNEWINSGYNTINAYIEGTNVYVDSNTLVNTDTNVMASENIYAGKNYYYESSNQIIPQ